MEEQSQVREVELPKRTQLQSEETIVYLARQHWYVFRNSVLITLFIPFVLYSAIFFLDESPLPGTFKDTLNQFLIYLSFASLVVGVLMFVWRLFLWRRTYYLVTNKRLVLVNQYSPFHYDDRETPLYRIQDVKAEVNGLQASLYGFGDVVVQISSQDAALTLEKVGKPHLVQKVIMKQAHLKARK